MFKDFLLFIYPAICNPVCQNNGRCIVPAGAQFGSCDCTGTGFVGPTCTIRKYAVRANLTHEYDMYIQ